MNERQPALEEELIHGRCSALSCLQTQPSLWQKQQKQGIGCI